MRSRQAWLGTAALLALGLAPAARAAAQMEPPASQHGSVSQVVNLTTITVGYDRPVLRGRSMFGDVLDYDAVWTPGANRATWIEVTTPVMFAHQPLLEGRYGIWMIPHESKPWEVILVTDWDTSHTYFPSETVIARAEVDPEKGPPTDVLTFDFPVVDPYETTLTFHWGDVTIPLLIAVGQ